ncbi:hypothetical protein NL154_05465 [Rhizobium sp. YTUHZ044]|uniref:hypothetical protein n=1 Tax=Rhizobium sp. YTUHZ044 TaxID=2962678 RepID=UPI003DA8A043
MNQKIISYTVRYPHARATTIQYLAKREETTKQLMREIHEEQLRRTPRPWWKRLRNMFGRV